MTGPNDQALVDYCVAAAAWETEYFSTDEKEFVAYAGLPPKDEAFELPFSCRIWAGTDPYDPDGSDGGSAGTGRMALGESEDPRTHEIWGYIMVADRSDPAGMAKLDDLARPWIDLVLNAYRANLTMSRTCSRVKIKRIRPAITDVAGPTLYAVKYVVQVVSRPVVPTHTSPTEY